MEERIAADLTGKRRDFERSMIQHREQMEREAKAMMAEMKNLSPTLFAGGCRDSKQSYILSRRWRSGCERRPPRGVGSCFGVLRDARRGTLMRFS